VIERSRSESILLADVGGTNVRFAVLERGKLGPIAHMAVADHRRFTDALETFLASRSGDPAIRHVLFGAAGVVRDQRCELTNSSWLIDARELCAQFEFSDVHIVNDFEAIGWALPRFTPADLLALGGGRPAADAPMLVLGPGTGLGVAAYLPNGQGGRVVSSEYGHSTLPSVSAREDAIIERLRQRFAHVSAERVLSGEGLTNLYYAIASLDGVVIPKRSAPEISKAGVAGSCQICRAALDAFCAWLGEVAGNLALAFGARGGVFIAGGIVRHICEYMLKSQFRSRFQAKGRMSGYVEAVPTYLIVHEDPAFVGLQFLAAQRSS